MVVFCFVRALALAAVVAEATPRNVMYYAFYQDPWCTAGGQSCTEVGCCDERLYDWQENTTLLNPELWPQCAHRHEVMAQSVLINPVAPNEKGGLDLDFLGQYYAKGATYYNAAGKELPWNKKKIVSCGGDEHDTPYSYNLPNDAPVPDPLCVPATPPAALERSIRGLSARGIRVGISILGGGGGDNIPGIRVRSQLHTLSRLDTPRFEKFLVQLRAAATVLFDWGITHFDLDMEGGIVWAMNVERFPRILDALRFKGGIVSVTTEAWALERFFSVLSEPAKRPDLIQLMMGDYSETLRDGIAEVTRISQATGYPLSNFRLGIKPQCGVRVGSMEYLQSALPELVSSGVGAVLWNMGRDYPCVTSSGECSDQCIQGAAVTISGQQPFTSNGPFAYACEISRAFNSNASKSVLV